MTDEEILHFLCEEIDDDLLLKRIASAFQWGLESQRRIDFHRLKLSVDDLFYCGERFDEVKDESGKEDLGWGAK